MRLYSVFNQLRDLLTFFRTNQRHLSLGIGRGTSVFEGVQKSFIKLADWNPGFANLEAISPPIISSASKSPSGGLSEYIYAGYYAEAFYLTSEFSGISSGLIEVEFPYVWFSRLSDNLEVLETKFHLIFGIHLEKLTEAIPLTPKIPPEFAPISDRVTLTLQSLEITFYNHETGPTTPISLSIPQSTTFNTLSILHSDTDSVAGTARRVISFELGAVDLLIQKEIQSRKRHMDSSAIKAKLYISVSSDNSLNILTFPAYFAFYTRLGLGNVYAEETNSPDVNIVSITFNPPT